MNLEGCARESELKQTLASGQWPQAVSDELRAHVRGCRNCREQVLLATAFLEARSASISAARVGTPGLVWWRAQLRRRTQAVERVVKPLLGAQIFAFAVMLVAALGFAGVYLRWQEDLLSWLQGLPQAVAGRFSDLSSAGGAGWLLPLVLLSVLALFGGAVVYFSSERG
jgi:hypothetical protein